MAQKMRVDIWSDVVCPFCYIGKRHYEAALAQFPHANDIETVWHSFLLTAGTESGLPGENIYQYLARIKGISYEQSVKMHERVGTMAANAGLQYNFDTLVVASSRKAHQLIQLAKEHNLGDAAEEQLFKAYFTDGKNIADAKVLMQIGSSIGLPEDTVAQALSSDAYAAAVSSDIHTAGEIGVQGVPFFVFANKYAVSGAQPPEMFLQALTQSHRERLGSV